jgi:hypothetical protein
MTSGEQCGGSWYASGCRSYATMPEIAELKFLILAILRAALK